MIFSIAARKFDFFRKKILPSVRGSRTSPLRQNFSSFEIIFDEKNTFSGTADLATLPYLEKLPLVSASFSPKPLSFPQALPKVLLGMRFLRFSQKYGISRKT